MKTNLKFLLYGVIASVLLVSACNSAPATTAPGTNNNGVPQTSVTMAPGSDTPAPATPVDSSTGSGAAAKVESYKLLQDNGSGTPGDEVKSFKASDHKQYFDVQLTAFLKPGAVVKWTFTAVDTSAGKNITITEVNTTVAIGNHLTANLSLDKDFPTGSYRADITSDGNPLGSIDYSVI